MTSLLTGMSTYNRPCLAAIQGQVYYTNNENPVKVMNQSAANDAGIDGPTGALSGPAAAAAGNTTNGTHLIRYRYRNSKTGFISNPSDNLSYTVSGGNGSLRFDVTTNYVASTDTKVDTIDIEMTPVNDSNFWRATSALNTATAITVSVSDATLTQGINVSATYGNLQDGELFANDPPPTGTVIVSHKNRAWVGGDSPYLVNSALITFASGATSVSYSNGNSEWVGRLLKASGDTSAYEISAVSSTTLTISAVYSGTSGSKAASIYKKHPNRVAYSRLNYPESFGPDDFVRDVLIGKGDRLRAIYSRRDALYFFGLYSSDRLTFSVDPSPVTSNLLPINGNRGCFNQRCVVDADGRLFAFDRLGMYEVGEEPRHISNHIDPALAEFVDYDGDAQFHGIFDPVDRVMSWFVVFAGDTVPKYAAVVELDTVDSGDGPRWQFYQFRQGITSSAMVASSDGQVRAWVGDENGYTWAFSTTNTFDGVYPTNPGIVTVDSGATTTVIPVEEDLYTTVTLAGAIAYLPSTGEERVISTNTANQITLASALGSAPSAGAEIWLGSFPVEYRSKWWPGQGMQTKKKPSYFYLMLYPGSSEGKLQVYFYKDFSTTPYTWEMADSTYIGWDGVTFPNGVLTVDLDGGGANGFVAVNMPSDQWRVMQYRLVSTTPAGTLRILDMGFRVGRFEEHEDAPE